MAVNNPFITFGSLTMIGITVFSDTMIILSTLKHILRQVPHVQVKSCFSDA